MSGKEMRKLMEAMVDPYYGVLADRIKAAVMKNLSDDMDGWKDDPDMIDMFKEDAKDSLEVVDFIRKGDLDQAFEKISDMDSAGRDTLGGLISIVGGRKFHQREMESRGWVDYNRMHEYER